MDHRNKSLLRDFLTAFCLTVYLAGTAIAVIQNHVNDRLPTNAYVAFVWIQFIAVAMHLTKRNFLTAVFGFCLTIMLWMATAVEKTPDLAFSAVYSRDAYTPETITCAYNTLLLVSCLFHALTCRMAPRAPWVWPDPDPVEQYFSRRIVWPFLSLGLVSTLLTLKGDFVTNAAYASEELGGSAVVDSAGLLLLSVFFQVFSIVAALRGFGYGSRRFNTALSLNLLVTIVFRLLYGSRSTPLVVFSTVVLIFYIHSSRPKWVKNLVLAGTGTGLVIFYDIWAYVRTFAHQQGLSPALADAFRNTWTNFYGMGTASGFNPLEIPMLPQSYWHLLHTVSLFQSGISLNGQSFIDLIPQSIPQFISDAVGYERPLSGAWLLAEYRVHAGGMFIIAEGYWNFGIAGAVLVALAMALIVIKLEPWYRKQEPFLACTYFAFLGTFGFGIFYGLQTFVKVLEITLVIAVVFKFVFNRYRLHHMRTHRSGTIRPKRAVNLSSVHNHPRSTRI